MPQGTVKTFDSYIEFSFKGTPDNPFDMGATPDVYKVAIVNNTIVPATDTANPTWGAVGTDLSANEESGGSYTVGGLVIANAVVSIVGGVVHIDFDDPAVWGINPGNPTAAYYGIVYSDTATNKNCVGYVDLGGLYDGTTGDLSIGWGAPFATADQGA
jgi:hypothetical protein